MATMLAVQDTIAPLNIVDIGHERTCSCPPNHLNCMSAKEWIRAQLGVWQFNYNGRDIRNKNVHPATFPISLPTRVIELFTHRGQLVVDPFVGSGTTLLAARDTARNAVGFDLSEDYNELAKNRLGLDLSGPEATKQMAIVEDARNAASYFAKDSVSLIFTSPPYANLLNRPRLNKSRRIRQNTQYQKVEQYSQDSRDLGTLALDEYAREMGEIFQSLLPVLRPGGHCVINVPRHVVGEPVHYLPIADTAQWELKSHRLGSSSLVTLFHMEPKPRAIVPKLLLPKYGWPHEEAGKRYPPTEMSFRQTIKQGTSTD